MKTKKVYDHILKTFREVKVKDDKVNGKEAEWFTENGQHIAVGEGGELVAGNPKVVGGAKKVNSAKEKNVDPGKKASGKSNHKLEEAKNKLKELEVRKKNSIKERDRLKKEMDKLLPKVREANEKKKSQRTDEDNRILDKFYKELEPEFKKHDRIVYHSDYWISEAKKDVDRHSKISSSKYSSAKDIISSTSKKDMDDICKSIQSGYMSEYRDYSNGYRDNFAGKATNAFMENLDYYARTNGKGLRPEQKKTYKTMKPFIELYDSLNNEKEEKKFKKEIKEYMLKKYPKRNDFESGHIVGVSR